MTAIISQLLATGRPVIMGVLNLTPDSFSDGDPGATVGGLVARAQTLIADGADILDIGGESTRPGAEAISAAEEIRRVLPFLGAFRGLHPTFPISLDTTKWQVALAAADLSIDIINDVGFLSDQRLVSLCRERDLHYVVMHSRGDARSMMALTDYPGGAVPAVLKELAARVQVFLTLWGDEKAARGRLIVDPGLGFAKTPEQSHEIFESLQLFQEWRVPLLVGISRKRFTQLYGGEAPPVKRDAVSADLAIRAVAKGARIIRTHHPALTLAALHAVDTQGPSRAISE